MKPSPSFAVVTIYSSQFPENIRRDLLESLRTRRVNHKFHYDSGKQTQKWLALHEKYSPARKDADCRAIYERSFATAAQNIPAKRAHVISLGCGGGQKDIRLLKLLKRRGGELFYTPCDVSAAMVLVARRAALGILPEKNCFPVVCDLATAKDLPDVFELCSFPRTLTSPLPSPLPSDGSGEGTASGQELLYKSLPTSARFRGSMRGFSGESSSCASRLVLFFGMIPNFEPEQILPKLVSLVRKGDFLLFSANMASGKDYASGVNRILPQYDNTPTRDWLMTFLLDLGVEKTDGELCFTIENAGLELKRIVARFHFGRARRIEVAGKEFDFRRGDAIRLFFSYRYTPERVREALSKYGLEVVGDWIAKTEEEGVFLCRKSK